MSESLDKIICITVVKMPTVGEGIIRKAVRQGFPLDVKHKHELEILVSSRHQ